MFVNTLRAIEGFGVRARLLLAFGVMVALALSLGGVGWWGVNNIQRALQSLQRQSLPDIAQTLTLAERSASLVAQAPFVANARILFHLDEEGARLREQLAAFSALVSELQAKGHIAEIARDGGGRLGELAAQLETALLDLVDVTRDRIFLDAEMRDRRFELNAVRESFGRAAPAPGGRSIEALEAAMIAGNAGRIAALEREFQRGRARQGAADPVARQLRALGSGEGGIFELRRRQLALEDTRTYLLAVSSVLSERLNEQVTELVGAVKRSAETRSAAASAVLTDSKTQIALLGLVCLIAALVSATYVVRDLGGNLNAVTRSMVRLAGGETGAEVPAVGRPDEIGSLARAFAVFKRNLLELDETTRRLTDTNRLLEAIFQHMNDGLSVFDRDGRLVAFNARFRELYGFDESQLRAGTPIEELYGALAGTGCQVRGLDGRSIEPERMFEARQGSCQRLEQWLANGRRLELRSDPMPEGGFVTVYTDLTERSAIEAQLRQAQKMESVGQLTGGLAHDFNNLLTAIIGNLNLLQEDLAGDADLRRRALRALDAAERGATITQRLLAFARKQALEAQRVDVNDLVEGMRDLIECSVGEAVTVELELEDRPWPVIIDPGQLENALMNLALNARDAMPEGGRLAIRTANRSLDEAAAARHGRVRPGEHVLVTVADTGGGMPPEVLEHVFEPFYTTKRSGTGSGLGLSMVYGFIKQSGGQVRVASRPGAGTELRLYLPRAAEGASGPPPAAPASSPAPGAPRPGTKVLLIEDEAIVRATAADMLRALGYEVIEAATGEEAVRLGTRRPELVLADVTLPGELNGPEAVARVRAEVPEVRVLFCSADARGALVEQGRLDGGEAFLQKPYSQAGLAVRLREVWEGGRSGGTGP